LDFGEKLYVYTSEILIHQRAVYSITKIGKKANIAEKKKTKQ